MNVKFTNVKDTTAAAICVISVRRLCGIGTQWYAIGVLHKHSADVIRSDTPWGSKPPQLQVGAFKSYEFCV